MKRALITSVLLAFIISFAAAVASAYIIKGFDENVDSRDIKIDGRKYIILIDACKAHGIDWDLDVFSGRISLNKDNREVTLLSGSRYYHADGKTGKLTGPVLVKKGIVYVPLRFATYTIKRLLKLKEARKDEVVLKASGVRGRPSRPREKEFRIKKVVIDPGHGGKDPGAVSRTNLYEKDVVLDVSRRIKAALEKKGIEVIMTRNSDVFIPLGRRSAIANKKDADLFVSIHANANKSRWVRGFEVYYLSEATDDNARALAASENASMEYEENSVAERTKDLDGILWDLEFTENREESIELAGFICREVMRCARPKRNKIRSARFYVLKGARMPAVLVELSYLSNKWDEKNLKKSSYKQKLADGVTTGILAYKDEYERMNGFSR